WVAGASVGAGDSMNGLTSLPLAPMPSPATRRPTVAICGMPPPDAVAAGRAAPLAGGRWPVPCAFAEVPKIVRPASIRPRPRETVDTRCFCIDDSWKEDAHENG